MAIKPEEVKSIKGYGGLTKDEIELFNGLEKKIDDFLDKNFKGKTVHYFPSGDLTELVLHEVKKKYGGLDWGVSITRANLLKRLTGNSYVISFWKWVRGGNVLCGGVVDTL